MLNVSLPKALDEFQGGISPLQKNQTVPQGEQLQRIMSLSNANAKGVQLWNIQHAIRTFGHKDGDTGSPEAQGIGNC